MNANVAELEACATELRKQLEQSLLQVRVSKPKYLLLCDETQTPKQISATDISFGGEMEQRSINSCKDVLEYMDVLLQKALKSQNTLRKLFVVDSHSFFSGYRPHPRRRSLLCIGLLTTLGVKN